MAFLVAALGCSAEPATPDKATVRLEVLDVTGSPNWSVLEQRPDAPVQRGSIRPSKMGELGGLSRLTMILPPPASIELLLPDWEGQEQAGPFFIRPLCGIDGGELPQGAPLTVAFEVLIDGELVARHEWTLTKEQRDTPHQWKQISDKQGLQVEPGALLQLRTQLVEGDPERAIRAGFADLVIEREQLFAREPASLEEPNLVLLVLDTLRRDRLSSYGYERQTTPHLDALAGRGTLFEQAVSTSSWTWPSTASILTGLLPEEHNVRSRTNWHLNGSFETLPEGLQREGYSTAAWSGNPLIDSGANFDQGFERFAPEQPRFLRTGEFLPEVEQWLEQAKDWKFFLYIQMIDPHDPYIPREEDRIRFVNEAPKGLPEQFERRYATVLFLQAAKKRAGEQPNLTIPLEHFQYVSDLYDACVATTDHYVGQVLGFLDERGLTDKTLVAVTADHGEELYENGFLLHGHSLRPELIDVPLILAGPQVPAGQRIAWPVSNRQLPGTLMDLLGLPWGGAGDAPNLFEDLARPLFMSTESAQGLHPAPVLQGVVQGNDALRVWRSELDAPAEAIQLFDAQRMTRRDSEPETTQRLLELLNSRHLRSVEARKGLDLETSSGHLESLRVLGYVDEE